MCGKIFKGGLFSELGDVVMTFLLRKLVLKSVAILALIITSKTKEILKLVRVLQVRKFHGRRKIRCIVFPEMRKMQRRATTFDRNKRKKTPRKKQNPQSKSGECIYLRT